MKCENSNKHLTKFNNNHLQERLLAGDSIAEMANFLSTDTLTLTTYILSVHALKEIFVHRKGVITNRTEVTEEEIIDLYFNKGYTLGDIVTKYNNTGLKRRASRYIASYAKEHNIPYTGRNGLKRKLSREFITREYITNQLSIQEISHNLKISPETVVTNLKFYKIPLRKENPSNNDSYKTKRLTEQKKFEINQLYNYLNMSKTDLSKYYHFTPKTIKRCITPTERTNLFETTTDLESISTQLNIDKELVDLAWEYHKAHYCIHYDTLYKLRITENKSLTSMSIELNIGISRLSVILKKLGITALRKKQRRFTSVN